MVLRVVEAPNQMDFCSALADVEAIQKHVARALYRIEVVSSDQPLELLVQRSAGFDLLIVGTTKVGLLERAVVGSFSSQIVMRSECSVAVVRVAPQVKKLLNGIRPTEK